MNPRIRTYLIDDHHAVREAVATMIAAAPDIGLRSLYEKLGASDRAHAVSIALRQRLIEESPASTRSRSCGHETSADHHPR